MAVNVIVNFIRLSHFYTPVTECLKGGLDCLKVVIFLIKLLIFLVRLFFASITVNMMVIKNYLKAFINK